MACSNVGIALCKPIAYSELCDHMRLTNLHAFKTLPDCGVHTRQPDANQRWHQQLLNEGLSFSSIPLPVEPFVNRTCNIMTGKRDQLLAAAAGGSC